MNLKKQNEEFSQRRMEKKFHRCGRSGRKQNRRGAILRFVRDWGERGRASRALVRIRKFKTLVQFVNHSRFTCWLACVMRILKYSFLNHPQKSVQICSLIYDFVIIFSGCITHSTWLQFFFYTRCISAHRVRFIKYFITYYEATVLNAGNKQCRVQALLQSLRKEMLETQC